MQRAIRERLRNDVTFKPFGALAALPRPSIAAMGQVCGCNSWEAATYLLSAEFLFKGTTFDEKSFVVVLEELRKAVIAANKV